MTPRLVLLFCVCILILPCRTTFADDEGDEPVDPFAWARRLDEADLFYSLSDRVAIELRGELTGELFVTGDESPGLSIEDPSSRDGEFSTADESDGAQAAYRLRLFLDGFYDDWLSWTIELRTDATTGAHGYAGIRAEQYFARADVLDQDRLSFQLGKFSAPIGNFIPRHHDADNPLTTWPLAYDHLTTLTSAADSAAALLGNRDVPDVKTWYTPIWQAVYGTGAMAFGTVEDFRLAFAVMNSAPASLPDQWDLRSHQFDRPSYYLRASRSLDITTTVGASLAHGPYDNDDSIRSGPGVPAIDGQDHDQTLAGIDVAFSSGYLELFAEAYWSQFEGEDVDDLELFTYYLEAKYRFRPGLYGAARFAQMFFGNIDDDAGRSRAWDRDATRVELGGGYFFTENLFVKATGQLNYTSGGREPDDHLLMVQLGLTF